MVTTGISTFSSNANLLNFSLNAAKSLTLESGYIRLLSFIALYTSNRFTSFRFWKGLYRWFLDYKDEGILYFSLAS